MFSFRRLTCGRVCCTRCPDPHRLVLRSTCNITLGRDGWCPGNIPHPVLMARQFRHIVVRLRVRSILPDLDQAIAATCSESLERGSLLSACRARHCTWRHAGRPRHRIAAHGMRIEQARHPLILLELQHRDLAITARTSQDAARLVRGPRHQIHTCIVSTKVEGFGPRRTLAPDYYAPVVAAGGEESAKLGVCPSYTPDCAVVAFERLSEAVRVVFYVEQLDGSVRGASSKTAAIVVEDCIVLYGRRKLSEYRLRDYT